MAPAAPLFTLTGVTVARQGRPILRGVDLEIPSGVVTAIVGPSGAGKTSLLRLLNRLDDPDTGTVHLAGQPLVEYSVCALRRQVGFVFQTPVMFEGTVADNLRIAATMMGDARETPITELLTACGLDESYANRVAADLSGGERQRVALARALATQPATLLLDEPTAALDPEAADRLMTTIREFGDTRRHAQRYAPTSIVLITHRLAEARAVSQHTVMLENGRVVETGPTEMLFTRPASTRARAYLNTRSDTAPTSSETTPADVASADGSANTSTSHDASRTSAS